MSGTSLTLKVAGDEASGDVLQAWADQLGGPEWLKDRRRSGIVRLNEFSAPSTDAEEWRYSRIGKLDLARHTLVGTGNNAPSEADLARVADLRGELGDAAATVVVINGAISHIEISEEATSKKVSVGHQASSEGPLGLAMTEPVDLFAAANDALGIDPVVVDVPAGVTLSGPVVIISVTSLEGAAVLPRVAVRLGADAECSVLEAQVSTDVDALVAPVTELSVGQAARLRYGVLQDLGPRVWQAGSLVADVGRDATLSVGVAALGGEYARLRIDCRLIGQGATGNLSSVYFGDHGQMLDLRTFQEHKAPNTTSNLLFKGAVADTAHSVYTGLIRIGPEARGTNAFQTNRNLKLSEHAWAESVPNLEIEHNDVRCSHASTVGPVDEDQRFYLESRGVPTPVAERLIVGGFFDEVVDVWPVPAMAEAVSRRIATKLDRQVPVITQGKTS